MNKIIIIAGVVVLIFFIVFSFISLYNFKNVSKEKLQEEPKEAVYQGPVPEGYNLEHFRQTGETIKEVN